MKIAKLTLISILLFLVTGCSVEYQLTFNDNQLTEKIRIDASESSLTVDEMKQMLEEQLPENELQSYQTKVNKNKKIELTNKYSTKTYKNSLILSQCYTAYNFIESDQYYDLTTSQTFTCNPFDYMIIDELTVEIKTNHKVLSSNADEVKGNTYIWKLTQKNKEDKSIQIRFSKEKIESKIGLIILGIAVMIAIIILITFMIQRKSNNKI